MRNAGLDESQAGIKISRRNINDLRYEEVTLMEKKKRERERERTKESLVEGERE